MSLMCVNCLVNSVAIGSPDRLCAACSLATDALITEIEAMPLPTPAKNARAIKRNASAIRCNADSILEVQRQLVNLQAKYDELLGMVAELQRSRAPRHALPRAPRLRLLPPLFAYMPQHLARA